jgi:hypothetical protein
VGLGEAVGPGNEDERPLPKVLFLVVRGQPGTQVARLADVNPALLRIFGFTDEEIERHLATLRHLEEFRQQAARHFDDLHDPGGDLGHTDALGVAAGQEDLDGLGCRGHAGCYWDRGGQMVKAHAFFAFTTRNSSPLNWENALSVVTI